MRRGNGVPVARSCFQINIGAFEDFIRKVQENPDAARYTFRTVTYRDGGAVSRTVARNFEIKADEPSESWRHRFGPGSGRTSAGLPRNLLCHWVCDPSGATGH